MIQSESSQNRHLARQFYVNDSIEISENELIRTPFTGHCYWCDCNSYELKLLDFKLTYGRDKIRLYVGYKYQVVSMTRLFHLLLCHDDTVTTIWSYRTLKCNQIRVGSIRTRTRTHWTWAIFENMETRPSPSKVRNFSPNLGHWLPFLLRYFMLDPIILNLK